MDLSLVDNIEFEYDSKDFPEFTDAMIVSADYNGQPMTDEQLDELNNEYSEWVHERLLDHLY